MPVNLITIMSSTALKVLRMAVKLHGICGSASISLTFSIIWIFLVSLIIATSEAKMLSSIFAATLVSLILLIATFAAYLFTPELKTVAGRCFMYFTVSLILIYFSIHFDLDHKYFLLIENSLILGLVTSYFWLNVLAFDIWWTFKHFRTPTDSLKRFKFYCFYVFGSPLLFFATAFVAIQFGLHHHVHNYFVMTAALFFLVMAILDVIFMIMTGYMIFQISKASNVSENSRFDAETER